MRITRHPIPAYRPFFLCRADTAGIGPYVWKSDERGAFDLPPLDAFRLAEKLKLGVGVAVGGVIRVLGRHDPDPEETGDVGAFLLFGRNLAGAPFLPVCAGEFLAFAGDVSDHDEVIRDAGDVASVVQYLCRPVQRQAVSV